MTLSGAGRTQYRERGSGALEFVMVFVPVVFLTMSIFEMAIAGWQIHSMAYAIEVADRYACSHGRTCSKGGNSCTIKVQDVANIISYQGPSLDSGKLNVTLASHAATVTCNPLSSCFTNTAQFPSSTDNGVGNDIKITATYPISNPIPLLWFGSSAIPGGSWTLGATTKGNIVY